MQQVFKRLSHQSQTSASTGSSNDNVGISDDSSRFRVINDVAFMGNFSVRDFSALTAAPDADDNIPIIPNLKEIAESFEQVMAPQNLRYSLKVYKDCFVARDAVDFLVKSKLAPTREQAVRIGKALMREYNMIEHVNKDHDFKDEMLYFRYLPKEERTEPVDKSKAKSMTLLEIGTALEKGVLVLNRRYRLKVYKETFVGSEAVDFLVRNEISDSRWEAVQLCRLLCRELRLFQHCTQQRAFEDDYLFYQFIDKSHRKLPASATMTAAEVLSLSDQRNNLLLNAADLEQGVPIKDHKWRMKTYKDTFIATQAVDYMIHSNMAATRKEAVKLGREMARKLNLFHHATGDHEFTDDYLFFRFTDEFDRRYPGQAAAPSLTKEELGKIANALRNGIKVQTHWYRMKAYPNSFLGSEVVDFFVHNGYADSRRQAVKLGRKLAKQLRLFRHVAGDHELKDEYLFFRFSDDFEVRDVKTAIQNASMPLDDIARTFWHGVKVSTHKYHFKSYEDTFLGTEGVEFLITEGITQTREEALIIGRALHIKYNLFDHVSKDHELKDEGLFYRFNKAEDIKDLSLIKIEMTTADLKDIARRFEANVEVGDNKLNMKVFRNTFLASEGIDYLVGAKICDSRAEAVELSRAIGREFNLFEHVTREHDFSDKGYIFRFIEHSSRKLWVEEEEEDLRPESELTEEELWQRSVKEFEIRMLSKIQERKKQAKKRRTTIAIAGATKMPGELLSTVVDDGRNILHAVCLDWASSFRKIDPRFQILKFFTEVSQEGVDEIEEKGFDASKIRGILKYFHKASVFTVWRPTSLEAIKKMMLGTAVGKGLDIKGKSAKRGKLSAFVPFLQISENTHKHMVKKLSRTGTIRLFFSGHAREGRDVAANKLEAIAAKMVQTVKEAKKLLEDDWNIDEDIRKDAERTLLLDMAEASISYIDEYCPNVYGIEIPLRLFWEAYIVRQDISRKPGSVYDTGRPSQPAFQDMNIDALQAKPKEGAPRAVLYQNADAEFAMNPLELLMAYEENDTVKPVVSDFDCFLLGTRGVTFQKPLPDVQLDTQKWCVSQIQNILDSPVNGENWTKRWLEVLKAAHAEGFHPEFPQFGFGDPKSYSIMEHAVRRLVAAGGGAVRHGAECFNFYFPQELDEEFLVVSDNVHGRVAWKYMDVKGLQSFLSDQIDLGYTFPLNLKWVLCDPGWKNIYDKLLVSQKPNVQDSMSIWYPRQSGLREHVENIAKKHPNGFGTTPASDRFPRQSGMDGMNLSMQELKMQVG